MYILRAVEEINHIAGIPGQDSTHPDGAITCKQRAREACPKDVKMPTLICL
jgi:hypothetical protein